VKPFNSWSYLIIDFNGQEIKGKCADLDISTAIEHAKAHHDHPHVQALEQIEACFYKNVAEFKQQVVDNPRECSPNCVSESSQFNF